MAKHLGTLKSFRFSDEELALLDGLAKDHGTQKAAVLAGLRALEARGAISDEELIAAVAKRIRDSKRKR